MALNSHNAGSDAPLILSDCPIHRALCSMFAFIDKHQASGSFPASAIWVGYSGGIDSHVLLDGLVKSDVQKKFKIKAIHVNHGLSAHADQWQKHCADVCSHLGVEFYGQKLNIICKPKESLEAKARQARYDYFASMISPGDFILTAHHQQDQAETLLIQLLRGAGPKGLAAMPSVMSFAQGSLSRPLLGVTKQEISLYAQQHGLKWIEDESNANNQFARNYLRNNIMSLLVQRWPSAASTLSRSARLCAESAELLDEYAETLLLPCQKSGNNYLLISELNKLSLRQQKLVLRYYLSKNNFALPSEIKLETVINNIFYARADRHPVVSWANIRASRKKDYLVLEKFSSF